MCMTYQTLCRLTPLHLCHAVCSAQNALSQLGHLQNSYSSLKIQLKHHFLWPPPATPRMVKHLLLCFLQNIHCWLLWWYLLHCAVVVCLAFFPLDSLVYPDHGSGAGFKAYTGWQVRLNRDAFTMVSQHFSQLTILSIHTMQCSPLLCNAKDCRLYSEARIVVRRESEVIRFAHTSWIVKNWL